MKFILSNKLLIIGIGLGAVAGYLYYYYVGCASGSCSITSKPLNSTAYGALLGALTLSSFDKKKIGKKNENE